jgi:RimJ/RimL family protein N-acetyltransferase
MTDTALPTLPAVVTLRDGRRVVVRPVRPTDRDSLQAAIRRLSPEARYARFMTPLRELGPGLLEQAVNPACDSELQLVASSTEPAGDLIVGGARFSAAPGSKTCEFAIAVVDDWQGIGLAHCLLEHLLQAARARGFNTIEGYVLGVNVRMLNLAKSLGFVRVPQADDPAVHLLRCDLQ